MNQPPRPLPSLSGFRRNQEDAPPPPSKAVAGADSGDPNAADTSHPAGASGGPSAAATGRVLVAVCTYNEADNLPQLTERIFAALPQADLLVVDDNSPDGCGQWALDQATRNRQIRVIIRENQRGLGGAIKCAMQYAVDQDYTFLANLDGDLSHAPESLPQMLTLLQENPAIDVVVGSRYCPGGAVHGWPLRRRWMSRLVNGFAIKVLRLPVSDCSGSFRCYRVSKLSEIPPSQLVSNGYSVLEEVLIKLAAQGARMAEVPIEFQDRTSGQSKLTLGETIRSATHLIKLAVSRR